MEDIDLRVAALGQDLEHGASHLTQEAVCVLGDAASSWRGDGDWEQYLVDVARGLSESNPTMAGLRNATRQLLRQLLDAGPSQGRAQSGRLADAMVAELRDAERRAIAKGADLLPQDGAFVTCSYGSAVLGSCLKARGQGKSISVIVFEPGREPGAHGARLAEQLAQRGVASQIIDGAGLADALSRVRLALVGADAVTADLVVNGTPSLALAQMCDGRVPFYVICQTIKFTPDVPEEPGFDRVPLALVSGVITEDGLLDDEDVRDRVNGSADAEWATPGRAHGRPS